ncbi:MAG: helix-turn-helix domain-containing protein, partial [Bacteroidota bacterium]
SSLLKVVYNYQLLFNIVYLYNPTILFTFVNITISKPLFTMINTSDFTKRLRKVIEYYDLSASAFADRLGVQRSSISHILSGRNKPSLEFVMKILSNFPEVELYWLLNGKGSFPKSDVPTQVQTSASISTPKTTSTPIQQSLPLEENNPTPLPPQISSTEKTIDKIVLFYTDGTFEAFRN